MPIELKNRREVFWDKTLWAEHKGVEIKTHHPQYRGTAFTCNAPWEGNVCGYFTIFKDGDLYRMYYRASDLQLTRKETVGIGRYCYAESRDGKHFTRPELGICEFEGSKKNNIIIQEGSLDNISFFLDENPNCDPGEKYKALTGEFGKDLVLLTSPDGIHFTRKERLDIDGAFDSLNLAFYDKERGEYMAYYRDLHDYTGENKWTGIRDIRNSRSKDFLHWKHLGQLNYGKNAPDFQMYTNNVRAYERAPHMYIGLPTRYTERNVDPENLKYLPDREHREAVIKQWGRSGYAMTDTMIMTSRDGLRFRRPSEAYVTPGPERENNWYYGDCYFANAMLQTAGERPGDADELSIYAGDHYRVENVELMRFGVRLDGFFSLSAGYPGGQMTTKPLTFTGDRLTVNFATSAAGYVKITLCSEDGTPLPGYESPRLFGDSVCRPVDFEKPLSALSGKSVHLRFDLCDADLYSIKFE
ncbi:MAG TPA: hypothetical protein PK629_08395 [Oscillospiraceae bacterium]|nr:hypothetical protein [Oscillospiraceae bacterium]HPF56516.1 hypothetical protein [Clostridiales bacterium]HPK35479.1 hypothetical protein [Oscillospiraceae bacterium]HPR75203.1 hypothetical protein [Oscillospiraceae bacterium]